MGADRALGSRCDARHVTEVIGDGVSCGAAGLLSNEAISHRYPGDSEGE
jgi:hypothetical protein